MRLSLGSALLATAMLVSCGGGGGSGGSSAGAPPTGIGSATSVNIVPAEPVATPTVSETNSNITTETSINPAGDTTVALGANSIQIPAGALLSGTRIKASVTTDSTLADRFLEATAAVSIYFTGASNEIQLDIGSQPMKADFKVSAGLPQNLITSLKENSNQKPILMYLQEYISKEEETDEAIDSFDAAYTTYDALTKTVTATIPASAVQRQDNGSYLAVVKIVLVRKNNSSNLLSTVPAKVLASIPNECNATNASAAYFNPLNTQLLIVGLYAEPRGARLHGGIDFRAGKGSPVYAAQSGYIANVLTTKPRIIDGETTQGVFQVVIRHLDGSASVYMHLTHGSVSVLNASEVDENKHQKYVEKNPCSPKYFVSANQQIALSGNTGTKTPHLHLGYIPPDYIDALTANKPYTGGAYETTSNPLARLGKLSSMTNTGGNEFEAGTAPEESTVQVFFKDNSLNEEILVRRESATNKFVSVAAQGSWNASANPGSFTKSFNLTWETDTPRIKIRDFLASPPYITVPRPPGLNFDTDNAITGFAITDSGIPFDGAKGNVTLTATAYDPKEKSLATRIQKISLAVLGPRCTSADYVEEGQDIFGTKWNGQNLNCVSRLNNKPFLRYEKSQLFASGYSILSVITRSIGLTEDQYEFATFATNAAGKIIILSKTVETDSRDTPSVRSNYISGIYNEYPIPTSPVISYAQQPAGIESLSGLRCSAIEAKPPTPKYIVRSVDAGSSTPPTFYQSDYSGCPTFNMVDSINNFDASKALLWKSITERS